MDQVKQPDGNSGENTSLIRPAPPRDSSGPMVLQLGGADEKASQKFSPALLWHTVSRRLLVSLPLGIVLSLAACLALSRLTEETYRSISTLRIIDKQPYLAFPTLEQSNAFAQTQVELLRSRFIIGRAVESDELAGVPELRKIAGREDPVQWVHKRLKVARTGTSELYEVSVMAQHPESAQKIAAAVVEAYIRFQTAESDSQRQRVLELLKDEQSVRERDIELQQRRLKELTREAGGVEGLVPSGILAGSGASPVTARDAVLANLQQRLIDAEVDLAIEADALTALRDEAALPVRRSEAQIDEFVAADEDTKSLNRKAEAARNTLKVLDKDHPKYARAESERLFAEKSLEAHRSALRERIRAAADDGSLSDSKDRLAQSEADFASQQRRVELLRSRIAEVKKQQTEQGDKSLDIEYARNELARAEVVAQRIAERKVHLTTESRAPSQVMVVDRARLPEFQDGPSLAKKLAMAGALMFFLPMGLLLGWDLVHRRVVEREQLERELDVKLVREIAALPTRAVRSHSSADRNYLRQSAMFEESVNCLRTSLAIDERLQNCQAIAVTSAVSGEGKTNLASQLAMSWSNTLPGRVLIVDADLRLPQIHSLFEIPQSPGLVDVLRGDCALEDAIVSDWEGQLAILPAGNLGGRGASQLFSSQRFRETLARLKRNYVKVIVDAPPILLAAESLQISKEADGALMCTLRDYSRATQVKHAYDRLNSAEVNVVGVVLNGVKPKSYAYGYDYLSG